MSLKWIVAARKDPQAVAVDPEAPAYVLFSLAYDLPELVSENPGWTLGLFDGGRSAEYLVMNRSRSYRHRYALGGVRNLLLTSSVGPRLTQYLLSSSLLQANMVALLSPHLTRKEADRVWERMLGAWRPAEAFLRDRNLTAYGEEVAHFVRRENVRDEHLTHPRVPYALVPTWLEHGLGSDVLHAQWVRQAYKWHARVQPVVVSWTNSSSANARLLLDVVRETMFSGTRRHTRKLREATLAFLSHLAEDPGTPSDVLEGVGELMTPVPRWMWIRQYEPKTIAILSMLARHRSMPVSVLEDLAEETTIPRSAFLGNPNLPERLGEHLLTGEAHQDFAWVALRHGPAWLLERFHALDASEQPPDRLAAAFANPATLTRSLCALGVEARRRLPGARPSSKIMRALAEDPDASVRAHLAVADVSAPVLEVLSCDPDPEVRHHVTQNEGASLPVLARLAKDDQGKVRRSAEEWLRRALPTLPTP